MRFLFVAILAGCASISVAGPAPAQKAKQPELSKSSQIGGKYIEEWIAKIHSKDPSEVENAIRTILLFGPELGQKAVPELIKELDKVRLGNLDTSIRVNLAIALGELLSIDCAKFRHDKDVAKAVPLLIRLLNDSQAIIKYRAALALGKIGPDAKGATRLLLALLRDPATWELRQAAAFALGRVAGDAKQGPPIEVLQALFDSVQGNGNTKKVADLSSQVRMTAIQSLTLIGRPVDPAAQAALDKAVQFVAQNDPDKTVQIWASLAHMNLIGKVEPKTLALMTRHLSSPELLVRVQAGQALSVLGAGVKSAALADPAKKQGLQVFVVSAVPALIAALSDPESDVRIQAAGGLGLLGPDAKGAVPALTAALNDREKSVSTAAALALGRIGKDAAVALPQLDKLYKNDQEAEVLRMIAGGAAEVIRGRPDSKDNPKDKKK